MHVSMHVRMNVCDAPEYEYTYENMYIIRVQEYVLRHACVHVYMYVCMYVFIHVGANAKACACHACKSICMYEC